MSIRYAKYTVLCIHIYNILHTISSLLEAPYLIDAHPQPNVRFFSYHP